MVEPEASVVEGDPNPRPELGRITLIVYDWAPGQTEVRIEYPLAARASSPAGSRQRRSFGNLVQGELETVLSLEA